MMTTSIPRYLFDFLTGLGHRDKQKIPYCDLSHAEKIYKLVAFETTTNEDLYRAGKSGLLYERLTDLYRDVDDQSIEKHLLKAAQNAFFFKGSSWMENPNSNSCINRPALSEISLLASLDIERRGERVENIIIKASVAHTLEKFNECEKLLNQIKNSQANVKQLSKPHFGALSFRSPVAETYKNINQTDDCPNHVVYHTEPAYSDFPIIVCALDSYYFKVFAKNMISSLDEYGRYGLHFHLINPDKASMSLITLLAKQYWQHSLSFSSEVSRDQSAGYYASARFLQLSRILKFLSNDILVLDADMSFSKAPEELLKIYSDCNGVMLKRYGFPAFLPWRAVGGGALLIRWNEEGRSIAKIISSSTAYLNKEFTSDRNMSWWLDQNALFLASKMCEHYQIKVCGFSSDFVGQLNHNYYSKQELFRRFK